PRRRRRPPQTHHPLRESANTAARPLVCSFEIRRRKTESSSPAEFLSLPSSDTSLRIARPDSARSYSRRRSKNRTTAHSPPAVHPAFPPPPSAVQRRF